MSQLKVLFQFGANPYLVLASVLALALCAPVSHAQASTTPKPDITPGTLCTPQNQNFAKYDYPEQIARCNRVVTQQMKETIARNYGGIPRSEWGNYEFDHLIPLCAGGSSDLDNLWPQPLNEAHQKDKLEDQVCSAMRGGKMTQAEAVSQIQGWFQNLRMAAQSANEPNNNNNDNSDPSDDDDQNPDDKS